MQNKNNNKNIKFIGLKVTNLQYQESVKLLNKLRVFFQEDAKILLTFSSIGIQVQAQLSISIAGKTIEQKLAGTNIKEVSQKLLNQVTYNVQNSITPTTNTHSVGISWI